MPELLEPPSQADTAAASDVFHSVQTFDSHSPDHVQKPESKPEVKETPKEAAVEQHTEDATAKPKEQPKSKLDKMGKVAKPEEKKPEAKPEEKPKAEEKPVDTSNARHLREAYDKQKADMAALRAELEKVRPDAEKVGELRAELEASREELTKLKAMNLTDEERTRFNSLREQHALAELRESQDFKEKIWAPINSRLQKIEKVAKEAKLDPAGFEALKSAMDLQDELDRNREIRRIFKAVPEMEPDDFTDFYASMTTVGRELNETLYPKLEQAEKQALDIETAARARSKEEATQAKAKQEQAFAKEREFVHKFLTDDTLKPLLEDTGLSVDGITLAQAMQDAAPSEDPRERAVEVLSAAALPFVIEYANRALAKVAELEKANRIRNGTQPSLNDGAPKEQPAKPENLDINAVFKGHGSFER